MVTQWRNCLDPSGVPLTETGGCEPRRKDALERRCRPSASKKHIRGSIIVGEQRKFASRAPAPALQQRGWHNISTISENGCSYSFGTTGPQRLEFFWVGFGFEKLAPFLKRLVSETWSFFGTLGLRSLGPFWEHLVPQRLLEPFLERVIRHLKSWDL